MGQKINPVSLRLNSTNRHFDSSWYSNHFYKNLMTKDIVIQHYLNNFLKLLKLPAGRYSIQHLQKKTRVYNFLCYSKYTRRWRSTIFGLNRKKNFGISFGKNQTKNRYFLKKKKHFKTKVKKSTKLCCFYITKNQLSISKIQKKITSFQNFRLWSTLLKKTLKLTNNREPLRDALQPVKTLLFLNQSRLFPTLKNRVPTLFVPTKSRALTLSIKTPVKNLTSSWIHNPSLENSLGKGKNSLLLLKENQANQTKHFISPLKDNKLQNSLDNTRPQSVLTKERSQSILTKERSLFLQNLFVYKTIKSTLKIKRNLESLKKTQKNCLIKIDARKSREFGLIKSLSPIKNRATPFNALELKYKNYLEFSLSSFYKLQFNLVPFKVKNDWQYASYLAEEMVYFLQRRIPFRQLKGKILKQLSKIPEIRGVRITCSGRVGGKSKKAQRAKTDCIKHGQTCLHVFSSKIDFSVKTAFTSFGTVGVKVWICYY